MQYSLFSSSFNGKTHSLHVPSILKTDFTELIVYKVQTFPQVVVKLEEYFRHTENTHISTSVIYILSVEGIILLLFWLPHLRKVSLTS